MRVVAKHRLIRSTHIATLVGRSLDRTNDRLMRLFHAGYVDRPRAQLDRFPTDGTAPMVYALGNRGARMLCEREGIACGGADWGHKNRNAGRPFIEHQVEIVNFQVGLERAVRERNDVQLIDASDLAATMPVRARSSRNQFALHAKLSHHGALHDFAVIPDLVFALRVGGKSRRNFMVEIDRGTMPVRRADFDKTSIERKMLGYLSAHAAREHEHRLGWKNFRVLIVTTDERRVRTMLDALRDLRVARSVGASLFLFATLVDLSNSDPLAHAWRKVPDLTAQLI